MKFLSSLLTAASTPDAGQFRPEGGFPLTCVDSPKNSKNNRGSVGFNPKFSNDNFFFYIFLKKCTEKVKEKIVILI
jgi:hypothetical protein